MPIANMHIILAALILALCAVDAAFGQHKRKLHRAPKSNTTIAKRLEDSKADLVKASAEYKASLEKQLTLEEEAREKVAQELEKRKLLLAQQLISKRDLEGSERTLAAAEAQVNQTRGQIAEVTEMIAEAKAEDQLSKVPMRLGSYYSTAALIRYNGPAHWVLSDSAKVGSFFASKFRRAMPISAYGQTAVHDHLGFDHRNSMDVAVNPDSAEGQELMGYLRSLGIPFIAFRYAVKGSATGAHIHVGYPSHRIGK